MDSPPPRATRQKGFDPSNRNGPMTLHRRVLALVALLPLAVCAACAQSRTPDRAAADVGDPATDAAALRALLDDFLAHADVASAHERFWADDLVYTSSDGTRTDKAEILAGLQDGAEDTGPGPRYSGEDVDIRLYGTTAVVAFRLVIAPPEGSGEPVRYNLNTGTFLKRDGVWRAVAWQSTRGAE